MSYTTEQLEALNNALATDPNSWLTVIGSIITDTGTETLHSATGIDRDSLSKASRGKAGLSIGRTLAVLKASGLRLTVVPNDAP